MPEECDMASIDDPKNTSGRLIGADQVQGTYIYNPAGDSLGSVEDVMIDKVSGRIAYAVVGFGGFLGIGDRHYPLPWEKLKYDTSMGWRVHRPTPPMRRWVGKTRPGVAALTTITAPIRSGTCRNAHGPAALGGLPGSD
jgi:sporulation protein YlmC with PRC-barrel domain